MTPGHIHSTESFGTVDGPGVRFVIFLQGCPMRCRYCHNPDSWDTGGGTVRSAESLLEEYRRNRDFYAGGGITVTGGEPLMQQHFVLELFTLAKKEGIHTCLDTSGVVFRPERPHGTLDRLMAHTDLVLLDIKHMEPSAHKALTGYGNGNILAFARYLDAQGVPVWVRHVLVPGLTDDRAQLEALGAFLATLDNVQALDVLPYHKMGVEKYRRLGLSDPLADTPPATAEQAAAARTILLAAYRRHRRR